MQKYLEGHALSWPLLAAGKMQASANGRDRARPSSLCSDARDRVPPNLLVHARDGIPPTLAIAPWAGQEEALLGKPAVAPPGVPPLITIRTD